MELLVTFYLIMNLAGLMVMRIDKNRARKHQYRISEKTLWLVALFGGSVGTTIGMQVFRHKTKHTSFKIGFPLLAILHVVLFSVLLT